MQLKLPSLEEQKIMYEEIPVVLPGSEFRFMNHGFAVTEGKDQLNWLNRSDRKYIFNVQMLEQVVRGLDFDGKRVLEVGCGRGGNCWILAKYFKPKQIVGLDYSKTGILFGQKNYNDPRQKFVNGDAMALPFKDRSFDAVVNIESSHCYPRPTQFYLEVFRVLKGGGSFRYADNMGPGSVRAITRVLKQIGFVVEGPVEITENVMLSIRRGSLIFNKILARSGRTAAGIRMANQFQYSYETYFFDKYRKGKLRYFMWRALKPSKGTRSA